MQFSPNYLITVTCHLADTCKWVVAPKCGSGGSRGSQGHVVLIGANGQAPRMGRGVLIKIEKVEKVKARGKWRHTPKL